MKIYKKILNLGYGICCLLPILYLLFGFLYVIKTGENATFDITDASKFLEFGGNFESYIVGTLKVFRWSINWFKPFQDFNGWLSNNWVGATFNEYYSIVFVIYYSEWVVLVSCFRLFGSVFGCMINFADRMLDKIGGTN